VLDRKGLREFGLVTGGVFALLFGLFFPWLLGFAYPLWPWILFAVLALAAWLAPGILRPVHTVWMRMALGISKLTTPIILGVVFFALFWPLGLIARLFRKDPMRRKMDSGLTSYRIESRQSGKNDLENPY
jgi:hypothetical protein